MPVAMSPASYGLSKRSQVSIRLINRTSTGSTESATHWHPDTQSPQLLSPLNLATPTPSSTLQTSSPSPYLSEANFSVPYSSSSPSPVESQAAINGTSSGRPGWWQSSIYTNPDVLLAFALILFYAIFVLFICVIIIRIVLTIIMTGSSFKLATSSDGYSDGIEGETSSRTRGMSQSASKSLTARRFYQQEMTSFAIDRTNSPSIIDEEEEEES